jgi:hypothetical protein
MRWPSAVVAANADERPLIGDDLMLCDIVSNDEFG